MSGQMSLFGPDPALAPALETVASPLCVFEVRPCPRGGRAVYGEPVDHGGCVNRAIRCLTCGCTGEESLNTERDAS